MKNRTDLRGLLGNTEERQYFDLALEVARHLHVVFFKGGLLREIEETLSRRFNQKIKVELPVRLQDSVILKATHGLGQPLSTEEISSDYNGGIYSIPVRVSIGESREESKSKKKLGFSYESIENFYPWSTYSPRSQFALVVHGGLAEKSENEIYKALFPIDLLPLFIGEAFKELYISYLERFGQGLVGKIGTNITHHPEKRLEVEVFLSESESQEVMERFPEALEDLHRIFRLHPSFKELEDLHTTLRNLVAYAYLEREARRRGFIGRENSVSVYTLPNNEDGEKEPTRVSVGKEVEKSQPYGQSEFRKHLKNSIWWLREALVRLGKEGEELTLFCYLDSTKGEKFSDKFPGISEAIFIREAKKIGRYIEEVGLPKAFSFHLNKRKDIEVGGKEVNTITASATFLFLKGGVGEIPSNLRKHIVGLLPIAYSYLLSSYTTWARENEGAKASFYILSEPVEEVLFQDEENQTGYAGPSLSEEEEREEFRKFLSLLRSIVSLTEDGLPSKEVEEALDRIAKGYLEMDWKGGEGLVFLLESHDREKGEETYHWYHLYAHPTKSLLLNKPETLEAIIDSVVFLLNRRYNEGSLRIELRENFWGERN